MLRCKLAPMAGDAALWPCPRAAALVVAAAAGFRRPRHKSVCARGAPSGSAPPLAAGLGAVALRFACCCARAPSRCAPVAAASLRPPSLPARRRRSRSGAAAVGLACAPAVGVFCSGGGRHGSASAAAPPAPASLFAEKQGGGACLPFGRLRRRRSSCPRPPLNDWGRGRAAFISRFARRCGAGCPLRRGFCPRGGDCGGGTPPLKVFFP